MWWRATFFFFFPYTNWKLDCCCCRARALGDTNSEADSRMAGAGAARGDRDRGEWLPAGAQSSRRHDVARPRELSTRCMLAVDAFSSASWSRPALLRSLAAAAGLGTALALARDWSGMEAWEGNGSGEGVVEKGSVGYVGTVGVKSAKLLDHQQPLRLCVCVCGGRVRTGWVHVRLLTGTGTGR